MIPRGRNPAAVRRYAALIDYLRVQPVDEVTLSLAAIGDLIGGELSTTARVSPSYWSALRNAPPVRDLWEAGWRARLDVKGRSVTFTRTGAGEG